jgi:HSP20 family protein
MASLLPSLWGGRGNDPFRALQQEMNRAFGDFGRGVPAAFSELSFPALDVTESDGALEVTAELPGVAKEDVDVSIVNGVLRIKGEKKSEKKEEQESSYLLERSYGSFSRSIPLPFEIGGTDIDASFKDGVLKIRIPRPPEAKQEAKRIEIKQG